jgi:hypothetical protein
MVGSPHWLASISIPNFVSHQCYFIFGTNESLVTNFVCLFCFVLFFWVGFFFIFIYLFLFFIFLRREVGHQFWPRLKGRRA